MFDHVRLQFSWPFMFFRKVPGKAFFQRSAAKFNFFFDLRNISYFCYITKIIYIYITYILYITYINLIYITYIINIMSINFNITVTYINVIHITFIHDIHHLHTFWHRNCDTCPFMFLVWSPPGPRAPRIFLNVSVMMGLCARFPGVGFRGGRGLRGAITSCWVRTWMMLRSKIFSSIIWGYWCYALRPFLLLSNTIYATLLDLFYCLT